MPLIGQTVGKIAYIFGQQITIDGCLSLGRKTEISWKERNHNVYRVTIIIQEPESKKGFINHIISIMPYTQPSLSNPQCFIFAFLSTSSPTSSSNLTKLPHPSKNALPTHIHQTPLPHLTLCLSNLLNTIYPASPACSTTIG